MRTVLLHLTIIAALLLPQVRVLATPAQASAAATPAATAFADAVKLHDAGRFAEAILLFQRAIDLGFQPVNQARFRLARAHARAGHADQALTELEMLAAGGFTNVAVLTTPDLDSLRATSRFKAFETRVNTNARPCAGDPNFRAFDFWIGEWDVQPTGSTRGPLGSGSSSIIERQLDGCVIQENWLPVGGVGAGKSFNIYNTVTKQWEQYYVDARGTITHYTGAFKTDGHLYFEAPQFGTTNRLRMTFFNMGPNEVRQLGHISTDGGKTWTVSFDLTYLRKK